MRVDSLWIYPIKGCRGQTLEAADVTTEGFEGDFKYIEMSVYQKMFKS